MGKRKNHFTFLLIVAITLMPIKLWAQEAIWGTSETDLSLGSGTIEQAFTAAKTNPDVKYVKLLTNKDLTSAHLYIEGGNFTLNLNGHYLSSWGLNVYDTNLTIVDTSERQLGRIGLATKSGYSMRAYSSTLTFLSGGIYGKNALYIGRNCKATIWNGVFYGAYYTSENGGGNTIENEGTLTIHGGTFSGLDNPTSSLVLKPNSKTDIKGGTFKEGEDGTIAYSGGTLDVSNYDAITEISIYNQNETLVAPLDSIVLPNNYCFYDEENAAVTQLLKLKKSYIGVAPSTNMHTITYEANGGVGEGFSYQAYGKHYLPECTFEAPSGMVFKGWLVEGKEYQEGNPITVYTNTTIKAVWTKYVPQIVINMRDSYGDGWDGNKIIVKKDDENIAEAKVSGKSASLTIDYDQTSEYTFYWQSGSYSDECSFEILLENELMLKHNDCDDYDNGQLILTIKAKPLDSYAIDEKDLTDYSQTKDIDVVSLSYTRNFTNTSWQSLYIPFEIPVTEELLADFEIADLNDIRQYDRDEDGVKDETVVEAFKVKSGTTLAANYPYLIRAKEAGEKTITVIDATLYAAEEVSIDCSSIREKFTFTGTYSRMESNELIGCYALSKGEWQPLAADATLGAFRVYLKIESRNSNTVSARAIRIHVVGEDDTTDINELESSADDQQPTVVYDLQGRRIMNADNLKGVYIINGKKVVK